MPIKRIGHGQVDCALVSSLSFAAFGTLFQADEQTMNMTTIFNSNGTIHHFVLVMYDAESGQILT